jgi:hypothetical protein
MMLTEASNYKGEWLALYTIFLVKLCALNLV